MPQCRQVLESLCAHALPHDGGCPLSSTHASGAWLQQQNGKLQGVSHISTIKGER